MWWLTLGALAAPITTDEVVGAALQNSVDLATAQAEVERAGGVRQASGGFRENPELQVGVGLDGSRLQGQLTQPVSVTGEGVHARRAASAQLSAAEQRLRRVQLEVGANARSLLTRLSEAEASVAIAEQQLDGANRLREVAEARLAAGDVPELDAQLARLEQSRAVATWIDAGQHATALRVELAGMTGIPGAFEVADDPLSASPRGSETEPVRSDVAAAEASVVGARAALSQERAAGLAPLELGGFYELDQGSWVVGPMATVKLPLWKQNPAGRAAALADLAVADAALAATRTRSEVQLLVAGPDLAIADRGEALLTGTVTDDADKALAALQQGYELGQVDLTTTLLLQDRVFEGKRGWYSARRAVAELRIEVALTREDPSLLPENWTPTP